MKSFDTLTFSGKRILVTGHTGFKGTWLSLWLNKLGAEVYGFGLEPPTNPSMFTLCNLANEIDHFIGDIRNFQEISARVNEVKPDIIFHLAAQPIVRQSFVDPLSTLETNIMGTAYLLEAVRGIKQPCGVVVVSSDKCYDNREWVWGYRENDPMGGKDPYSMSKGATELVAASWRESFFKPEGLVKLATARAGNVIGGGDWAPDRLIPDCIRAFIDGRSVELRNPGATRPWQHVLEPLSGYIMLGAELAGGNAENFCEAWNFGPASTDVLPVENIVRLLAEGLGEKRSWSSASGNHPPEARTLALNCDKAFQYLSWRPTWTVEKALNESTAWYKAWRSDSQNMKSFSLSQIEYFQSQMIK